jgi:hypothetical protein
MPTDPKPAWYANLTAKQKAVWDELDAGEDFLDEDDENLVVLVGRPEKPATRRQPR